jgi:hypothetical protein
MLQAGVDQRTWVREALDLGPTWWRELAGWPDERQDLWADQAVIMEIQEALTRDAAEQEAYAMLTADESRRIIVAVRCRSP